MRSSSANLSSGVISHRALSTLVRVTLAVMVVGVPISLLKKPQYRTSTRILLEDRQSPASLFTPDNPVSSLFRGANTNSVANQIELLKSEQILTTACRDADVPREMVQVAASRVKGSDVVQIDVTSSSPTNAERFAQTLPQTFMFGLRSAEQAELMTALTAVTDRLKQESAVLITKEEELSKEKPQPGSVSQLGSEVETQKVTVSQLISAHEKLKIRARMGHDPVTIISPAGQAKQAGPGRLIAILRVLMLGLTLGTAAALGQAWMRSRRRI